MVVEDIPYGFPKQIVDFFLQTVLQIIGTTVLLISVPFVVIFIPHKSAYFNVHQTVRRGDNVFVVDEANGPKNPFVPVNVGRVGGPTRLLDAQGILNLFSSQLPLVLRQKYSNKKICCSMSQKLSIPGRSIKKASNWR